MQTTSSPRCMPRAEWASTCEWGVGISMGVKFMAMLVGSFVQKVRSLGAQEDFEGFKVLSHEGRVGVLVLIIVGLQWLKDDCFHPGFGFDDVHPLGFLGIFDGDVFEVVVVDQL